MSIRVRRRGADTFAERIRSFTTEVREGSARAADLLGPTRSLEQSSDALRAALTEVRLQNEELVVAEEELRAQLEELARMGARLEAERERYSDLFENAPDAYLVTDRHGVIRDANAAAIELFGLEIRFLRGKPLSAFLPPADLREMNASLDALATEPKQKLYVRIRPRQGGDVNVVAHLTLTSQGQRLLWTIRRAPAPSTLATGAELREALREKGELLDRERGAREQLERENRAKDRFIAVLSHDLRAPLSAILGWTQILRRDVLDASARGRALETIERNARAQGDLIEQLLDISRMAADRIELALAPLDFAALAKRVVDGAVPRASELGITLSFEAGPDLTVVGDRQRLEQVITNLLSNAMKYTPEGGRITVAVTRDGATVQLVVGDSGAGISPELLPHIFDIYIQEQSYSSARDGLGLGLYIVKRLVELQKGTISVASEGAGRGTTCTVRLPGSDTSTSTPSTHELAAPISLHLLRVLVVDDEEDSRDLMLAILRSAGAEVVGAGDARAALEVFGRWTPDVVVSDLAMPGGDGFELVGELRARDASVAALAVSGFTSAPDMERALSAGFDVHISKPVDDHELVEAVYEASRLRHR